MNDFSLSDIFSITLNPLQVITSLFWSAFSSFSFIRRRSAV